VINIRGMPRKLRYSERKRLAETGSLGPLLDAPSEEVKNAVFNVMRRGFGSQVGDQFGWNQQRGEKELKATVRDLPTDKFLDFIEILIEEGITSYRYFNGSKFVFAPAIKNPRTQLNDLFERHRFGYRIEEDEIRQIGSPALDEEIVGPALLAVQRPGWDEVERSFKEALAHQRGPKSENDNALTAANAALEAALKAAGYKGNSLGPLAKDFKKSAAIPSELKGMPEMLETLLGRSMAIRSNYGDSHGKESESVAVPDALVALAINLAGTFIVYLAEETT
jgi:hypothetical protein